MPIVAPVTVSVTTREATGLLTLDEAARRVARVLGGPDDPDILDESEDAVLEAIEDLNVAWDWDFLRKTTTVSVVSGTADYDLPDDLRAIYAVRLASAARPIYPFRQRDYERMSATPESGTPVGYNVFPSSTVEALDPQHTSLSIRFIPTPEAADTATILYYRRTVTFTSMGATIDLPRQYQYWVVNKAKALALANHGGEWDRAAYYEQRAARMLQLMKFDDQNKLTDETSGVEVDAWKIYDPSHPYAALIAMDGY